jgi:TRAP-type C4-dicarboxylate transport system substrate-binding protein
MAPNHRLSADVAKKESHMTSAGKKISMYLLVAALMALACMPLAAQQKVVKLRYSMIWPATHPISLLNKAWGDDVEKATEGRVTVTTFPGNTLSPPMQVYDNVVKGIIDVGGCLLAYAPGRLPLSEVLQQPLGYKNGYQATKLANAYYDKFKPKEFDEVKVMYLHGAAPGFIMTKKAVNSIREVKGLRIKANAENADLVVNLGASPVTMPVSEAYDSLQRGVIDGTLFPIEALQGYKVGEVLKTVIEDYNSSYMTSFYVIMNKDKWNSISPADQKAIEKINQDYIEKQGKLWIELDTKAKEWAIGKGVKFIVDTPADQQYVLDQMKPIWKKYVDMAKGKGLPGDEALKFCQDYLKANP